MPSIGRPAGLPKAILHRAARAASDRQRSVARCTPNLGLAVLERGRGEDDHGVDLGRNGQNRGAHLRDTPNLNPTFPVETGESGVHFDPPGDSPSWCAALKANGVRFAPPPTGRPRGWHAPVVKPDGNEIRVMPA
jgi:hypothetical protein